MVPHPGLSDPTNFDVTSDAGPFPCCCVTSYVGKRPHYCRRLGLRRRAQSFWILARSYIILRVLCFLTRYIYLQYRKVISDVVVGPEMPPSEREGEPRPAAVRYFVSVRWNMGRKRGAQSRLPARDQTGPVFMTRREARAGDRVTITASAASVLL